MILKKKVKKILSLKNLFINFLIFKVFNNSNIPFESLKLINGRIRFRSLGILNIKKNVKINSGFKYNPIGGQTFMSITVCEDAELVIGEGSGVSNSTIYCSRKIIIGKNVFIGGDCRIYDTDFHSINISSRLETPDKNVKQKEVVIKDGAFVGAGSIILKGSIIGENSVIGAGSVVSREIPKNEIWAGNPAKFIRKIDNE